STASTRPARRAGAANRPRSSTSSSRDSRRSSARHLRENERPAEVSTIRSLEARVGQEVGVSPWVEITQERIDTFAKAIEDFQWIHVDPARARSSPFGGTIAHGFLTLSLLSHLAESTFSFSDRKMGINYGLNRVRFTSPVPVGSRVRARFTLQKFERIENHGARTFCSPLPEDRAGLTDVICDDITLLTLQYSTQWDSFAHIGSRFDADGDGKPEIVFYNGFRAGEHVVPAAENPAAEPWARYEGTQARALGIENLAVHGVQGRGVMIDLHQHFGRERHPVNYDELMRVLDKDKVTIERGDM